MTEESEFSGKEQDLTREQKLQIAKDATSAFFQSRIADTKKKLEEHKEALKKDLTSPHILFIGSAENTLIQERKYLRMAEEGKFFVQVDSDAPDVIYSRLKRNVDLFPQAIEDLIAEMGDQDDPEVREFRDEESRLKSIVKAIEATIEFEEFQEEESRRKSAENN